MNLLKDTRCYLAGPVEHDNGASSWRKELAQFLSELGVKVYDPLIKPPWMPSICRVEPSLYFKAMKGESTIIRTGDERDIINKKTTIRANQMMREACMRIVGAVDWLICYLPLQFTAGTFEETYEALRVNKPVLFCCPDGIPSHWVLAATLLEDEEAFLLNWSQVQNRIRAIDQGRMKLDPLKWMFLSWHREGWDNPLGDPEWRNVNV